METRNMIPLFTSHYSVSRSILTLEEVTDITDNSPVSIFSIAKKYDLDQIYLAESSFSGFVQFYKKCKEYKKHGIFGIKLIVCENLDTKDEDSIKTESKVIVWMKNSAGYKDLIKIYTKAATDGFYYQPRIDWQHLKRMVTKNLNVSIPFYDSFIFNNLMVYDSRAVPDFGDYVPALHLEDHMLPFSNRVIELVKNYTEAKKLEIINSHSIYYFKDADFKAYCVFRSIDNRSSFNKPNLDWMSSDKFSFEEYKRKTGGLL
jgi:DNA polymerase-3 subunit alpha